MNAHWRKLDIRDRAACVALGLLLGPLAFGVLRILPIWATILL